MREREVEQRLRDWYQARVDDAGAVPPDLQARIQAIPDVPPQRHGLAGFQRRMVILAAATLLLVLLVSGAIAVGAGLLPWLNDDSDTTILAPAAWEDQELTDVEPGTFSLDVPGDVRVTFTLGVGWERVDVTQYLYGNGKSLNIEVVDNLYGHTCHWEQGPRKPPVGPSVDDLANALAAMSRWEATAPTDIVLDGHTGKRVQLVAPSDSSSCDEADGEPERFLFHVKAEPRVRPVTRDGEHLDVWILDVQGTRVVIIAGSSPRPLASDLAQLQAVIDSITFE